MKLFLCAFALLVSSSFAQAKEVINCNAGIDPYGGKFCHYQLGACANVSCSEAAKCAVLAYDSAIEGKNISVSEARVIGAQAQDGDVVATVSVLTKTPQCKSSKCAKQVAVTTRQVNANTESINYGKCVPEVIEK